MNNPTADARSYDYYTERYTGTDDNGGVHLNSGIANLAYVLLVDGGTHQRGKRSITVPAIGMDKAEEIFYYALTTYMHASSNFSHARNSTANAASVLFGAAEKKAIECEWAAVGVGSNPSSCGTPTPTPTPTPAPTPTPTPTPTPGEINEVVSLSQGQDLVSALTVPADATNINFSISGDTGDADLYVKFGSQPSDTIYPTFRT